MYRMIFLFSFSVYLSVSDFCIFILSEERVIELAQMLA